MAMNQKLDRNHIEDILALTPTQAGMLYHYVTQDQNQNAYIQQLVLELEGDVRLQHMEAAWQHVTEVNDMLRAVYRWDKLDHPVQVVLKQKELPVAQHDLTGIAKDVQAQRIQELREQERRMGLDIAHDPVRIVLIQLSDRDACMIMSWHHLVFDGWSNGIVLQEWLSAYASLQAGEPLAPAGKTPFKSYLRWQQDQDHAMHAAFWRRYLDRCEPQSSLSLEAGAGQAMRDEHDASNSASPDGDSGIVRLSLDAHIARQITALTRSQEITPAALFYTVWGILLQQYTQSEDVLFGTTVSGRPAAIPGIEQMVGMFIATVPLRLQSNPQMSAAECLQAVHQALKERDGMEYAPLVDISKYAGRTGEALFDSIVVLENYPLDLQKLHQGPLRIRRYHMEESTHYAMTLGIQWADGIDLEFAFDASQMDEQSVRRLANHYRHVLLQITNRPELRLCELELVTEEEKHQLLFQFNRKLEQQSQSFDLVHAAFEKQAALAPNQCAIQTSSSTLTYEALNDRANQLARILREAGVQPDQPVALLLPRTEQLFIAMLGVWKAGGAYIPIDHEYPQERVASILADSQTQVLLTASTVQPISFGGKVLMVDDDSLYAGISSENVTSVNRPENIAYIIYTSGSSGKPKGVMVEHRHLLAYVDAFQSQFQLTAADVVLQQASCSFDHFVEEVYPALLNGASVMAADRMQVLDMNELQQIIEHYGVTVVTCQPLMLNELNKRSGMDKVRLFISGGDTLKKSHISQLLNKAQVYNSYGPTEATVCASYHRCTEEDANGVPIGQPIRHYRVYVLDAYNRLMPVGMPGEICIAGAGVARGYYGDEAKTQAAFATDPFYPQERMLRTGDLGKWLPDGRLVFLGRHDDQVKVRGYRVEPGEIEHVLAAHPDVEQAVVIPVQDNIGEFVLAAYVKSVEPQASTSLRSYLSDRLPSYMLPAYLYRVERIPMTAHAKVDKRMLQEMNAERWDEPVTVDHRSASATEEQVREIWREVLGRSDIGLHERFFDIGGNSLLLMQLHAKLEKAHGWHTRIADLFAHGTIAAFATFIEERERIFAVSQLKGYVHLQEEFFTHEPWANGEAMTNVTLPAEQVDGLSQFAIEHTTDVERVLLAAFAYVLAEVSETEKVVLQSAAADGETILPLALDLSNLSSLRELFAIVQAELENSAESSYRFSEACAAPELLQKSDGQLLALFYSQSDLSIHAQELLIFELALGYEVSGSEIILSCKSNNRRLTQHKIQALFNVYVDVLKQFSEIRVLS